MFGLKNIFPVYIILAEREYQEGFETMIFFSRNNQFFEIKIILLAVGKERKKNESTVNTRNRKYNSLIKWSKHFGFYYTDHGFD